MIKSYSLRSAYAETFVGGHVKKNVEGESVDLRELLETGNGEIITDDAVFQSVLDNYYGSEGLVFKSKQVQGDERIDIPQPNEPPVPVAAPGPPQDLPQAAPESTPIGQVAAMPPAEHSEGSEYANMPDQELREVINERGLKVPGNAKTDKMVAALEEDDASRAANPQ